MESNILVEIKKNGFKITPVRKAVVNILATNSIPLSVQQISDRLKKQHLNPNKTTLYREMAFLQKQGIAAEVEFGDGKKRYEILNNHHHHIICINCHKIVDIPMEKDFSKESQMVKKMGFNLISHSLEFFGVCQNCRFGSIPS